MATVNQNYHIGDEVRVSGLLENAAGTDTDPAVGPVVKYRDPAGVVVTKTYPTDAEVVKVATGSYYLDIAIDQAGQWRYRFSSTGNGAAAAEHMFVVLPSGF